MWKCSVCGQENPRMVCRKCGLWECEDILSVRSLTPLSELDVANYEAFARDWNSRNPPAPPPAPVPPQPVKKKSPLAAIAAVAAVVCALAVGFAFGSGGKREAPETLPPVIEAEETIPPDNWKNNVLMEDRWESMESGELTVLGSSYLREDIQTISFVDLMDIENIPNDHWDVSQNGNSSVLAWVEDGKDLYIGGKGGVCAPENCEDLFHGYFNVTAIRFDENFHTDMAESFNSMFSVCSALTTLNLSGWDTSQVQDMNGMFFGCDALTTLDLSSWDTSQVTDMGWMFFSCDALTALDLSGWDTSQVTDMESMFRFCPHADAFELGTWETDSVYGHFVFMDKGILVNGQPWENLFKK